MLLGSHLAKIDHKFRLKVPAQFRRELPETEDNTYFVTSIDGKSARIYPLPVWQRIAQKFLEPPQMEPVKKKLQFITSYYGLLTQMDSQGRILIPQELREDAAITGDVKVMAQYDHLEVWSHDSSRKKAKEPWTDEEFRQLAAQGF